MTLATLTSQPTLSLNLRLLLLNNQYPSLLRLTKWSSKCTLAVFSMMPPAEPTSIMLSVVLDSEPRTDKTTGSSETPGELLGEIKDTSRSLPLKEEVFAVSKCKSLPSHRLIKYFTL